MKRHFLRLLLPLLVMALILIMSTTPGARAGEVFETITKPFQVLLHHRFVIFFLSRPDWLKVGHVIAYGIFGIVLYSALQQLGKPRLTWPLLLVFSFACLDEYVQSFTPGRSAAFADVLLDVAAALLAMLVVKLSAENRRLKAKSESQSTQDAPEGD